MEYSPLIMVDKLRFKQIIILLFLLSTFLFTADAQGGACIVDAPMHIEKLRVVMHFVSQSSKEGNFIKKKKNGLPRGRKWAKSIIKESNRQLSHLKPNWKSPAGTKRLNDAGFRLLLKGVRFIYNDSLACIDDYEERASAQINDLYGAKLDKAINIYFFEDYFRGMNNGGGIANRSHRPQELFIKMYNYGYTKAVKFNEAEWILREEAATLIHEVGHILGLDHDWFRNDGMPDTIPYQSRSCLGDQDIWENCSNNFMTIPPTYSSLEGSFTPCQIKKMSEEIEGARKIYVK